MLHKSAESSSDQKLEVSYGPVTTQQQIPQQTLQYAPQVVYVQAQPQPLPAQVQPVPQRLPIPGRTQLGWSEGNEEVCCNCSQNCGFCMLATFFPCCAYGKNRDLARHGDIHNEDQHGCVCNSDCWKFFGVCALTNAVAHGAGGVTTAFLGARSRQRLKAYIGEPDADRFCSNYCTWLWCSPCAMTQERTELKKLLENHRPQPIVPQALPQPANRLQPPAVQHMLSGQEEPRIY